MLCPHEDNRDECYMQCIIATLEAAGKLSSEELLGEMDKVHTLRETADRLEENR